MKLSTNKIVVDRRTQVRRYGINYMMADEYRNVMAEGDLFPPIDVFLIDGRYILADGHHRLQAIRMLGRKMVEVKVHQGSVRDAMLFALRANQRNGMRLTVDDKRAAVDQLLGDPNLSGKSDREIAKLCGVSHTFVAKRRGLDSNSPDTEDEFVELPEDVREKLLGTDVVSSIHDQKRLASLPPEDQGAVVDILSEGSASSVRQAIRAHSISKASEEIGDVSHVPVDAGDLVMRHCRVIGPGEYRVMFSVDDLGFRRIKELAVARGLLSEFDADFRSTLAGTEFADMMRAIVRETWERQMRLGLKDRNPQDVLAWESEVWPRDTFAARGLFSIAIHAVHILVGMFILPDRIRILCAEFAERAKRLLDNEQIWHMLGSVKRKSRVEKQMAKELVALQRSLFTVAATQDCDVVAEAMASLDRS